MVDVSAHDVCHQLLYQLRLSNLHFGLSETPHSVQIMLRKRFLHGSKGPALTPYTSASRFCKEENDNLENENHHLVTENEKLKRLNEELFIQSKSSGETIKILEQKVTHIEAEALKSFNNRNQETSILKKSLKDLTDELETSKKNVSAINRTIKLKEKENYKLEQKNDNLADTVKKMKSDINTLKQDKRRLEKHHVAQSKNHKKSPSHPATTSQCHQMTSKEPSNLNIQNESSTPKYNSLQNMQSKSITSKNNSLNYIENESSTSNNNSFPTKTSITTSSKSSQSTTTSSMVSHWIPIYCKSTFQRPGSLSSMISHCALLPSPGSSLITKEEFLEEMEKLFKNFWKD